jgi:hypothetical protein
MLGFKRKPGPRKRSSLLDNAGFYEITTDPISTSTRQAGALQPAMVDPGKELRGDAFGEDAATGQPIVFSPHEAYEQKRISSPNVTIIGAVGVAKTSALMTQYVLRPLNRGAHVALFDRKNMQGQGEYARAAQAAQSRARIVFNREEGKGAILNILDPRIATSGDAQVDVVGQDDLLKMVAEEAYRPLSPEEGWALGMAHKAAIARAQAAGEVAILSDVVEALFNPPSDALPHPALEGVVSRQEIQRWGLPLALALRKFIDGHLSGLINGKSVDVDGAELDLSAQFLLIDTSALPEDSPALGIVMAIVATYLSSVWANVPGVKYIGIEEGYHTANLPAVSRIFRTLSKRSRGVAISMVAVFHHLSDVSKGSDASALIRESGIVHIYKQDKSDDAIEAIEQFNLPRHILDTLMQLPTGRCVLKIGAETPRVVEHVRSTLERHVTDNDAAMMGELIDTSSAWAFDDLGGGAEFLGDLLESEVETEGAVQ